MQETGETRDAIIEKDNAQLQAILNANKERKEPYYIVLFAKPFKQSIEGKPTLIKHLKAYATKPASQVGMVIGIVDNAKGTIEWEVNMPQRPFDFNALLTMGAKSCDEMVIETTTIADAYVTR